MSCSKISDLIGQKVVFTWTSLSWNLCLKNLLQDYKDNMQYLNCWHSEGKLIKYFVHKDCYKSVLNDTFLETGTIKQIREFFEDSISWWLRVNWSCDVTQRSLSWFDNFMALVSHSIIQGVLVIGLGFFAALHLEIAKYSYLQNISFNMEWVPLFWRDAVG